MAMSDEEFAAMYRQAVETVATSQLSDSQVTHFVTALGETSRDIVGEDVGFALFLAALGGGLAALNDARRSLPDGSWMTPLIRDLLDHSLATMNELAGEADGEASR